MIRVLTFGRYADANFGGLERYVFELARGLQGEVEYTNIVADRGELPDVALVGTTIRTHTLLNVGGTPVCPSMLLHARRAHKTKPFDIVHVQFPADPVALVTALSMPRSVKRIVTWHSDVVRQRLLFVVYRPLVARLLRSADAIIAATPAHFMSSRQLEDAKERGIFHVVAYGLDLERFRNRPQRADDVRGKYSTPVLVFALGRHVYYKGFEFLIRAMAQVPEAQLILGGHGPLTFALRQLANDAGVANRVTFAGRISEAELPAYYHACDLFCLPSVERSEAFGMVQVEAMAAGKPVVCCDLNNGVNWVNRAGITGLAVPPADAGALAIAIRRLGTDAELRARLGAQAREHAFRHFTTRAMALGTLDVYRKVLQAK